MHTTSTTYRLQWRVVDLSGKNDRLVASPNSANDGLVILPAAVDTGRRAHLRDPYAGRPDERRSVHGGVRHDEA